MKHFRGKKRVKKLDFASNGRRISLIYSFKPSLRLLSVRGVAKRVVWKIPGLPEQARNDKGGGGDEVWLEVRYILLRCIQHQLLFI